MRKSERVRVIVIILFFINIVNRRIHTMPPLQKMKVDLNNMIWLLMWLTQLRIISSHWRRPCGVKRSVRIREKLRYDLEME